MFRPRRQTSKLPNFSEKNRQFLLYFDKSFWIVAQPGAARWHGNPKTLFAPPTHNFPSAGIGCTTDKHGKEPGYGNG